jgi:photosystem II stability/assembly factor-like uncharacterized protein
MYYCPSFHTKKYKVMRLQFFSFLLLFQSLAACQQVPQEATELAVSSLENTQKLSKKAQTPLPNILFQSTDGGLTWQNISADLPSDKPVEHFSTRNGEVFLTFPNVLYRSLSGATPPVWEKEMWTSEQISGIFSGRTGLYTVSYANGFSKQISVGLWIPVFAELGQQAFRAMFESADGSIFVGCDKGIFKSADSGKTWKHVVKKGWMLDMVESNGVLICTSEQGILRSADGGENWEVVVAEGGVGIDVEVINGGFAEISYNTTSKTRRMRISEDGGKTWQPIDADLPAQASISGIKQVGQFLICGHPNGIMRSADRGKTWQLVLPSIGKKVFNLSVSGSIIYAAPLDSGC